MKNFYEIHEMIRDINDFEAAQLFFKLLEFDFNIPKDAFAVTLAFTIVSIEEIRREFIDAAKQNRDKIDLNFVLLKVIQSRYETILPEYHTILVEHFSICTHDRILLTLDNLRNKSLDINKINYPTCEISIVEYYGNLSPIPEKTLLQSPLHNMQPILDPHTTFLDILENKIIQNQHLNFLTEAPKKNKRKFTILESKYTSKAITFRTFHEMLIDNLPINRIEKITGISNYKLIASLALFRYNDKNLSISTLQNELSIEEAAVVFKDHYDQLFSFGRAKALLTLEQLNAKPLVEIHAAIQENTTIYNAATNLETTANRLTQYLLNKKIHFLVLKVLTLKDINEYLCVCGDNYKVNLNRLALKSIINNNILSLQNANINSSLSNHLADYLSYLKLALNDLKNLGPSNFDVNKIDFNLEYNVIQKADYFQAKPLSISLQPSSSQNTDKSNCSELSKSNLSEEAGPSRKKMKYDQCFFANTSVGIPLPDSMQNDLLNVVMNKPNKL